MKKRNILITIIFVLIIAILINAFVLFKIRNNNTIENSIFKTNEQINIEFIDDILPMYPIGIDIKVLKTENDEIILSSSDNSIAIINNNYVTTISKGIVTIKASYNDQEKSIELNVTDLYTMPDYHSENKPFLKETICTKEEAHMLDQVLESKINNVGYKTRAGVVEAARFLSLQFPYKIAYMSESGRLDMDSNLPIADGEGRYYHKGLFLSEDKFEDLTNSIFGRATWGQFFEEDDSDDHSKDDYYLQDGFTPADIGTHLYLSKRPNGLDCSGFVSWCYLNGGFDFGDLGAGGPNEHGMTDLGKLEYITNDLLQSDKIKAGDLVGLDAHIGIVIGVEEDYIWIADTLVTGLKVTKYKRNAEAFETLGEDSFKYFILMDTEYLEDGSYTEMW